MKLRNAHLAIVDRSKVLDYLLNEAHPDNGGESAILRIAGLLAGGAESAHGEKHVVDGRLSGHTQERRQWSIRTVWIIERGEDAPRLVTAYPGKE